MGASKVIGADQNRETAVRAIVPTDILPSTRYHHRRKTRWLRQYGSDPDN